MRLLSAPSTARRGRSPHPSARGDTAEAFPAGGDRYQRAPASMPWCASASADGSAVVCGWISPGGGSGLSEVDAASRRAPPYARSARWRSRVPARRVPACIAVRESLRHAPLWHPSPAPLLRAATLCMSKGSPLCAVILFASANAYAGSRGGASGAARSAICPASANEYARNAPAGARSNCTAGSSRG